MQALGLDPERYNTHSFRRGGAQYLHFVLKKQLVEICEWGGWAQDFQLVNVLKYLNLDYSHLDFDHRANFLNYSIQNQSTIVVIAQGNAQ